MSVLRYIETYMVNRNWVISSFFSENNIVHSCLEKDIWKLEMTSGKTEGNIQEKVHLDTRNSLAVIVLPTIHLSKTCKVSIAAATSKHRYKSWWHEAFNSHLHFKIKLDKKKLKLRTQGQVATGRRPYSKLQVYPQPKVHFPRWIPQINIFYHLNVCT